LTASTNPIGQHADREHKDAKLLVDRSPMSCPIRRCCASTTPQLLRDQRHCSLIKGSLIDAAQHRGVTTTMLAFLGRFLPKLGGVRFQRASLFFV